ncbi:putative secreted protease domain protein [Burkholderia mallei]|nr:putative secreted protease domain protein [Burkholderia mallei]
MALEHEACRHVAPTVGARDVIARRIQRAEHVREAVRARARRVDRLLIVVLSRQIFGETLDPPDGRLRGARREIARHVVAAVEIVRELVLEVPDLELGPQPRRLVRNEARLVAGRGRIAFEIHAAVVGADAVDHRSIFSIVRVVVEDDELDRIVAVARHRLAPGLHHPVEVVVLLRDRRADRLQLRHRHVLRENAHARVARVTMREHRVGEPFLVVARAVVRAVARIAIVDRFRRREPQVAVRARHARRREHVLDHLLHARLLRRVAQEAKRFARRVRELVRGARVRQARAVRGDEAVERLGQRRVAIEHRLRAAALMRIEEHREQAGEAARRARLQQRRRRLRIRRARRVERNARLQRGQIERLVLHVRDELHQLVRGARRARVLSIERGALQALLDIRAQPYREIRNRIGNARYIILVISGTQINQ